MKTANQENKGIMLRSSIKPLEMTLGEITAERRTLILAAQRMTDLRCKLAPDNPWVFTDELQSHFWQGIARERSKK